jgi:hypothetical protein
VTARAALVASLLEVRCLLGTPGVQVFGAMAVAALRADWARSETPVDAPAWDELLDLGLRLRRDELPSAGEVDAWLGALDGASVRAAA